MPKTKPTDDRMNERMMDVLAALPALRHLRGYPPDEVTLETVADAVATFCETAEVFHGATDPEYSHPSDLGNVVPLQWLIREIAVRCTWFPQPIEMRGIYEEKFPPLDKRRAAALTGGE